jgi:hypothetical protein
MAENLSKALVAANHEAAFDEHNANARTVQNDLLLTQSLLQLR